MSDPGPAFLLAPGAGAPSSHPRMRAFAQLLGTIGSVQSFDYPYALEGRSRPDPLPKLIAAHRAALAALHAKHDGPIVLAGKSMGGRVGYPLCGAGDRTRLRDRVLLELKAPILFVQGTRDPLCPLDLLEGVRKRMHAPTALYVVEGGDHSLVVSKTALKALGSSQDEVDDSMLTAIARFLREQLTNLRC
jgi:uncharacterized protein